MMKWEYYSKRRNISLLSFIKIRDIGSFEALNNVMSSMSIEGPTQAVFNQAYAIAFPPPPKLEKKPKVKAKVVKKTIASPAEIPQPKKVKAEPVKKTLSSSKQKPSKKSKLPKEK